MVILTAIMAVVEEVMRSLVPIGVLWSGGKDSSAMLNIVLQTAKKLVSEGVDIAPIIVCFSDTLVDNPEIANYVSGEVERAKAFAETNGIPLHVLAVTPPLGQRWPVSIIGKGAMPTFPDSQTKKCTEDLKGNIQKAASKLFVDLGIADRPVYFSGTRRQESAGRASSMAKRGESGTGIWVSDDGHQMLSPIADWSTLQVWEYLSKCASGEAESYSDFAETFRIYNDASGDSCAVNTAESSPASKASG
jgi:3'-phosphoadenosine 5'-phosphosulfate sulfotransferase (PAPS reductase)/FAD synthetase